MSDPSEPNKPDEALTTSDSDIAGSLGDQLASLESTKRQRVFNAIFAAALGSVPWVGGFLAAMLAMRDAGGQAKVDGIQRQWLDEHQRRMAALAQELNALKARLECLGDDLTGRLESDEYLALIRKGFRIWDQADTDQKRGYIGKLLANAGATKLVEDDLIRLFLEWLDTYHEAHFKVIRHISQHEGCTRRDIWAAIHGAIPREDSAEADLFKLLMRDLSTGGIIRQHKEKTYDGQFLKKPRAKSTPGSGSATHKSAFDDEEGYELTELGRQFVHYVFSEVVQRLGD